MIDFEKEIRKNEVETAIKMNELGGVPLNEKGKKFMSSYISGEVTYEELLRKAIAGEY